MPATTAKSLLLIGALGIISLLNACQTAPKAPPPNAVICSKCKILWVEHLHNTGYAKHPGPYIPVKSKIMVCPDCESAIVTFFKTGRLKHHCATCGGTLDHCTYH